MLSVLLGFSSPCADAAVVLFTAVDLSSCGGGSPVTVTTATTSSTTGTCPSGPATSEAFAQATGNGLVFSVVSDVFSTAASGFVTSRAIAAFSEAYVAVGGTGSGVLSLSWATTCAGNNQAFDTRPRVSLSDGSTTVDNPLVLGFSCLSNPSSGEISIPFEFGVTQLTVSLETFLVQDANGIEQGGRRTATATVRLLDALGNEIPGASLATVVPEPAPFAGLAMGLAAVAVSYRRRRSTLR